MLKNLNKILLIILPSTFIIGPAIVNISVFFITILTLIILYKEKKFYFFKNKFFFIFFIFCIYLIFISLISEYPRLSLEGSLFYFRFGILVIAYSYFIEHDKNFLKYFFACLLACFIILYFDSIYQFIFKENVLGFSNSYNRITSFFNEENILGSYFSRLFPLLFLLILYFYQESKFSLNLFLFFIILLTNVIIFLSGERTAYFINIFSIILILIFTFQYIKFKFIIFTSLLATILFIVYFNPVIKARMINLTIKQINLFNFDNEIEKKINNSATNYSKINLFSIQHEVIFSTSYKIFLDNKLFGIGPKNFRNFCKLKKYKTYTKYDGSVDGCNTSPHNIYLQILTETGLIGFIFIICIWFYLFYILVRQFISKFFIKNQFLDNYQIIIFILIFTNLFPLIPTGNIFNSYLSTILYLPIGFLNLYKAQNSSK